MKDETQNVKCVMNMLDAVRGQVDLSVAIVRTHDNCSFIRIE